MNITTFNEWCVKQRHPILLAGLISFFILPELIEKLFFFKISFPIMLTVLVASGLFVLRTTVKERLVRNILVLGLVIFLFVWNRFQNTEFLADFAFIILFLYFFLITFYLYKDLLNAEKITPSIIIGAFSGYFLIGVMWFFVFGFFDSAFPDTFNVDFTSDSGPANMLYFSFITLTTIGFGDYVPTSTLGQKLVILEGLTGQFYLVIVMAILVGKYMWGTFQKK